jgi:hypothetical protein
MHPSFYEPLGAQQIVFPDLDTITALTNRKRKLAKDDHHTNEDGLKLKDTKRGSSVSSASLESQNEWDGGDLDDFDSCKST